jgi:stage V sporulation protein G
MMEITEVRINLKESSNNKLKAFATITIDNSFVVRDIKIIDGKKGLFVAMPSSKVSDNCPSCGKKTPIRNRYCGECGKRLPSIHMAPGVQERREEHRDVAHPINPDCRDYLSKLILDAYYEKINTLEVSAVSEDSMV